MIAYRAVSSPYLRRTLQRKDGPWPAPGYKQEQVTVTHAPRTTTANTKSLQCLLSHALCNSMVQFLLHHLTSCFC